MSLPWHAYIPVLDIPLRRLHEQLGVRRRAPNSSHGTPPLPRKKSKIGFEVYPAPNMSTCIVEPYNAMLSTHWLLDHTEVSLVLDNEAIYSICQKQLEMDR